MTLAEAAALAKRGEDRRQLPPVRSVSQRPPHPPVTVVIANSKGGVGKSSIAYMYSLFLSITRPDVAVEVVDLDPQGTTVQSLQRFCGKNLTAYDWEHFFLFAAKLNNRRVLNHIARRGDRCQIIDTAAGLSPATHSFLYFCDVILVPLSASDADVFATKTFLESLIEHHKTSVEERPFPEVILLPNQIDDPKSASEIAFRLRGMPAYMGRPISRSPLFRRAFRSEAGNDSLIRLLKENQSFLAWLTGFIAERHSRQFLPGMLRPV